MHQRIVLIFAFSLLAACQGPGGLEAEQQAEVPDAPVSAAHGEYVYSQHCATCHGAAGTGNAPWFPSLQRLAQQREPAAMVETVITGRFRTPNAINNHAIPIMPAWGQLSDADVAAIVNYIQQNWGAGNTITADQVQAVRAALWEQE